METYFINSEDVYKFYARIAEEFELYLPVKIKSKHQVKCDYGFNLPGDDYLLKKYSGIDKEAFIFNEYRCVEPLRTYFTFFKEQVCDYFKNDGIKKQGEKPLALCGVKNCDLFSLKIQDYVFLGGNVQDAAYKERRENTLIISGDCLNFKEACFCGAFDISCYAAEGFDFNFSPLNGGYLVDAASPKAKQILQSLKEIFAPAGAAQLSGRLAKRELLTKRMQEHLRLHNLPKKEVLKEIVISGHNSGLWQEQMRTCVECGGCMFICGTCHCFLLADELAGENASRLRIWDGCLFKNFTKVAGGANPLKMRYMRLRNRYLKKFDFFIDNMGTQACSGCGRCIEVCPGKIDIRYILRRLYETHA